MGSRFAILQRKAVSIPAAFAVMTGGAFGYGILGPQDSATARLYQQASSALDDYLNRSPGERDETALLKGKGKGKGKDGTMLSRAVPAGEPEQEALGKVFDLPETLPDTLPDAVPAALVLPEFAASQAPSLLSPGGLFPFAPGSGGGGGGVIGGGGPGGGGPGGGNPGGGGGPGPVGPVPEPSAWAMMLLGFFFTGSAMRRAKHRRVSVSNA